MKSSKRGAQALKHAGLEEYLAKQNKRRLQEIFSFWHAGKKVPSAENTLKSRISKALSNRDTLFQRFSRFTESQQNFLFSLVGFPEYAAALPDILAEGNASRIPRYELDSVLRALSSSGIIAQAPAGDFGLKGRDVYYAPRELGDLLASFKEGIESPPAETSLSAFLEGMDQDRKQKVLKNNLNLSGKKNAGVVLKKLCLKTEIDNRLNALVEDGLRDAVIDGILDKGGIVHTQSNGRSLPVAADPACRSAWRRDLENNLLGTIGELNLSGHGIDFEGETLVVFGEVARAFVLSMEHDPGRPDEIHTCGCDLLVELSRLLRYVKSHRMILSSERTFYKDDIKNLLSRSFLFEKMDCTEQEFFSFLVSLMESVGVFDVQDEVVPTSNADKWMKLSVENRIEKLLGVTLTQKNQRGSDFHQRGLRKIAVKYLSELEPGRWYHPKTLVSLAVSEYLDSLEDNGIGEKFKSYKFRKHHPQYSLRNRLRDLRDDLQRWVRYRLFPLGLIEFAEKNGEAAGIRLSEFGCRVLGKEKWGKDPGKILIVTPDYEALLFPEGNFYDTYISVAAFAEKKKQDQVTHFEITENSVKRAIFTGQKPEEIIDILESRSRTPVPQNVKYSILDWNKTVSHIRISRPYLLEAEDESTMRKVRSISTISKLVEREICPTAAVLREKPTQKKLLRKLKEMGIYMQ